MLRPIQRVLLRLEHIPILIPTTKSIHLPLLLPPSHPTHTTTATATPIVIVIVYFILIPILMDQKMQNS